jgi:hypothetical protein
MTFIPDTILRAICWTLLHSLWQGLIFAIVAGIVLVLTKKASSSLRYNLLCCGMILFLAVSGYTFYHQLHIPAATEARTTGGNLPAITGGWTTTATPPATTTTTSHTLRNNIDSLVQYFNTHASLVVVIWFIIFLARFVQLLSGLVICPTFPALPDKPGAIGMAATAGTPAQPVADHTSRLIAAIRPGESAHGSRLVKAGHTGPHRHADPYFPRTGRIHPAA